MKVSQRTFSILLKSLVVTTIVASAATAIAQVVSDQAQSIINDRLGVSQDILNDLLKDFVDEDGNLREDANLNDLDLQELIGDPTRFLDNPAFQELLNEQLRPTYEVTVSPQQPKPGDRVQLLLTGLATDVNNSEIGWFIDEEFVAGGLGKTTYSFIAGRLGEVHDIRIVVNPPDRATPYIVETRVAPSETTVLWQSVESTAPPFYKGKALPSYESIIKLVVEPTIYLSDGVKASAESLTYKWSQNGKFRNFSYQSGYGQVSALAYVDFIDKNPFFSVDVTSQTGTRSTANTVVSLVDPEIRFYKKKPLDGIIYERSLSDREVLAGENTYSVIAEPFYFSNQRPNLGGLGFRWLIGNEPVTNARSKKEFVLVAPNSQNVRAEVALEVRVPSKLLQEARQEVTISTR